MIFSLDNRIINVVINSLTGSSNMIFAVEPITKIENNPLEFAAIFNTYESDIIAPSGSGIYSNEGLPKDKPIVRFFFNNPDSIKGMRKHLKTLERNMRAEIEKAENMFHDGPI